MSAVVWEPYLYLVLEHSAHPQRELVSRNCQTSQTCNMTVSRPSSMTDTALLRWGCNISPVIDDSHQSTSASWLHRGSNVGLHIWGSACCPQLIPLWRTLERWNYCETGQLVAQLFRGTFPVHQVDMGSASVLASKVPVMAVLGCQLDYT